MPVSKLSTHLYSDQIKHTNVPAISKKANVHHEGKDMSLSQRINAVNKDRALIKTTIDDLQNAKIKIKDIKQKSIGGKMKVAYQKRFGDIKLANQKIAQLRKIDEMLKKDQAELDMENYYTSMSKPLSKHFENESNQQDFMDLLAGKKSLKDSSLPLNFKDAISGRLKKLGKVDSPERQLAIKVLQKSSKEGFVEMLISLASGKSLNPEPKIR